MDKSIVVALITSISSVIAVIITSIASHLSITQKLDKQQAVFEAIVTERIGNLQKQVEKHNSIVDRTFELEKNDALQDAELKRLQTRLKAVEEEKQ